MSSTREEAVNAILDKLFVNGMGQRADRMVLVQEDYSGKATVSNAHDLGGWSRLPIRDLLLDALRQREQEVREQLIRVLGAKQVADLAHHAIGIWQAFEESYLFNNSAENGQRIHDAVEDARQIAKIANEIHRRDDTPQEGEGS
jgi:hypothetical protein